MKAKNYLSIGVRFEPKKLSIELAASKLAFILMELGKVDPVFLFPKLSISDNTELGFDLTKSQKEELTKELAEGILKAEWNELTKELSDHVPTINYVRLEGYPVLLRFELDSKTLFWIGCRIGSNVYQTMTIRGFSSNTLFEFSWYEKIFKALIRSTKAELGTVVISNESFGKFYNQMNIKYPIGWITYFSDSYEICLPNDLSEVRYEFKDNGKYLFTSDEDFMKDKEAYNRYREKLQRIIIEIKARVPKFSKVNK